MADISAQIRAIQQASRGEQVRDSISSALIAINQGTASDINNAVQTLESNFQAGVDSIYDAVVAKGSTPTSKSLSDVVEAIGNIQGGSVIEHPNDTFVEVTFTGVMTSLSGNDIWTDGENIYYSNGSNQYIFNKSASTWSRKIWNINIPHGNYIWTDGENIYCSNYGQHYVLDKSTFTWEEKTWSGLTTFYGDYIWSDGENVYYSSGSNQYILNKSTSTWTAKTWSGLTSFDGRYIWTDGENIYYSYSTTYILNKSTSTWTVKPWNVTIPQGSFIWHYNNDVYLSYGANNHYILNKSTGDWDSKNWPESFIGVYIWTDGDTCYFSASAPVSLMYDYQNDDWVETSFIGPVDLQPQYIWTDGENTYYSGGASNSQYILDKSTLTWVEKTWNGLESTPLIGNCIWSDGDNVYYSYNSQHYILDKSTSTWSQKTWNGFSTFEGQYVWSDGENIYTRTNGKTYKLT